MAAQPPYIFGRYKNNVTPQLTSQSGEPYWFTVPSGWYMKPSNAPSQVIVSPNSDFSPPTYQADLADDGMTYAFQDLLLERSLTYHSPHR